MESLASNAENKIKIGGMGGIEALIDAMHPARGRRSANRWKRGSSMAAVDAGNEFKVVVLQG